MRKSILVSLISLCLVVSFFSGCAKRDNSNKIVIWHWMTDRDDAFIELANRYKELKGIDIVFELYAPSQAYSAKVKAAAQTDTLPDVYGILSQKSDFASFINAGHVENLEEEMSANNNEWENSLFEKALDVNRFNADNSFGVTPGIYGVPIDVTNIQLVYNKALFKKAGLDPANPPKTWEEFIKIGKELKAKGIPGLVSGWGEIWMIDCFASNYAFNIMGKDKVLATIKGDVPYTDPDWITVLGLFQETRDADMLVRGIVSMVNKTAEQMFANERAALAFNGSWCVNVYHGMNPNLDYGVMFLPQYSDKYPMVIWGGAGSSFVVNAKSKKKEDATQFLKWLTQKDQQVYLAEATRNLPVNKNSLDNISETLAEFADDMDKTTHPSFLPYTESPSVTEAFGKGIQSIIIGEATPSEIAGKVAAVKKAEMERAAKGL